MSKVVEESYVKLQSLHTMAAKASIANDKYMAGVITKEQFKKEIDDLNCHCYDDIVLHKKYHDLDCCYKEILDGILRVCNHKDHKENQNGSHSITHTE